MKETDYYIFTDMYFPLPKPYMPPALHSGWVTLSEIYNVVWDDSHIIATMYPKRSKTHQYYIIYARDSILTSSPNDIVLGPLSEYQKDSVVAAQKIDLSQMKELDFNCFLNSGFQIGNCLPN